MKNQIRRTLAWTLTLCFIFALLPINALAAGTEAGFADMPKEDFWSYAALKAATEQGILTGYPDGRLRPERSVTRAEAVTMITRLFGAGDAAALDGYTDVKSGAWYEAALGQGVQMKLINGYENYLYPNQNLTREQAFTILARAIKLEGTEDDSVLAAFSDAEKVSDWAYPLISAMVSAGYVAGKDGKLAPGENISRQELAQVLYNVFQMRYFEAGTYSEDITGSLLVTADAVILKDCTISGDLIVAEGVGNGDFTLDNVTLLGRLIVRGGGEHSIHITNNSSVGILIVNKTANGALRIYTASGARVNIVEIDDNSNEIKVEGTYQNIKVNSDAPVVLNNAEVSTVTLSQPNSNLTVNSGSVAAVKIEETAAGSEVKTGETSVVGEMEVLTPAKVEIGGKAQQVTVAETAGAAKITTASTSKVAVLTVASEATVELGGKTETVTVAETAGAAKITTASTSEVAVLTVASEATVELGGKTETVTVAETAGNAAVKTTATSEVKELTVASEAKVEVAGTVKKLEVAETLQSGTVDIAVSDTAVVEDVKVNGAADVKLDVADKANVSSIEAADKDKVEIKSNSAAKQKELEKRVSDADSGKTTPVTPYVRTYTITWQNADGTELQKDTVTAGTVPAYEGATPVYATYTFYGWDKEIAAASEDCIYKAVYSAAVSTKAELEATAVDGAVRKLDISGNIELTDYLAFTAYKEITILSGASLKTQDVFMENAKLTILGSLEIAGNAQQICYLTAHTSEIDCQGTLSGRIAAFNGCVLKNIPTAVLVADAIIDDYSSRGLEAGKANQISGGTLDGKAYRAEVQGTEGMRLLVNSGKAADYDFVSLFASDDYSGTTPETVELTGNLTVKNFSADNVTLNIAKNAFLTASDNVDLYSASLNNKGTINCKYLYMSNKGAAHTREFANDGKITAAGVYVQNADFVQKAAAYFDCTQYCEFYNSVVQVGSNLYATGTGNGSSAGFYFSQVYFYDTYDGNGNLAEACTVPAKFDGFENVHRHAWITDYDDLQAALLTGVYTDIEGTGITIPSGATVTIPTDVHFYANDLTLETNATIINYGYLNVNSTSGRCIENKGTISNYGWVNVQASYAYGTQKPVVNVGNLTNESDAASYYISNDATVTSLQELLTAMADPTVDSIRDMYRDGEDWTLTADCTFNKNIKLYNHSLIIPQGVTLTVNNKAETGSDAYVDGITVDGALVVNGSFAANGTSEINGSLTVNSGIYSIFQGTLDVYGSLTIGGNARINLSSNRNAAPPTVTLHDTAKVTIKEGTGSAIGMWQAGEVIQLCDLTLPKGREIYISQNAYYQVVGTLTAEGTINLYDGTMDVMPNGVLKLKNNAGIINRGTLKVQGGGKLTGKGFVSQKEPEVKNGGTYDAASFICHGVEWDGTKFLPSAYTHSEFFIYGLNNSGLGFFFLKEGTNETAIPYTQLSSSNTSIFQVSNDNGVVRLLPANYGTATINYVSGGKTYSMPVTVQLPVLGFYSASAATEANCLDTIYTDGGIATAYLIWTNENSVITDVEPISGINMTKVNDRCYRLDITENFKESAVRITCTVSYGSGKGGQSNADIEVKTGKGLEFRYASHDKGTGSMYVDENSRSSNSLTLGYGNGQIGAVYYVDRDTSTADLIPLSQFTVSDSGILSVTSQGNLMNLQTSALGSCTINYTVGGKTYKLPVTVTLPDVGCYSTQTASVSNYISSVQPGGTFYLVTANDWKLDDVTCNQAAWIPNSNITPISDSCYQITVSSTASGNAELYCSLVGGGSRYCFINITP